MRLAKVKDVILYCHGYQLWLINATFLSLHLPSVSVYISARHKWPGMGHIRAQLTQHVTPEFKLLDRLHCWHRTWTDRIAFHKYTAAEWVSEYVHLSSFWQIVFYEIVIIMLYIIGWILNPDIIHLNSYILVFLAHKFKLRHFSYY